jgi:hypothetical protein
MYSFQNNIFMPIEGMDMGLEYFRPSDYWTHIAQAIGNTYRKQLHNIERCQ